MAAAIAWAVAGSTDWLVWTGSIVAGVSVLAVGPVSHRIWYR
ncbi:hypothetical protein ACFQV2_31160 [Actinokineospora soli]|uniref:Uncharacterized protein n=1 Tax=Actinokineospora soli TaxID=1048753 RepID=A0ABW2TVT7_9PSEU